MPASSEFPHGRPGIGLLLLRVSLATLLVVHSNGLDVLIEPHAIPLIFVGLAVFLCFGLWAPLMSVAAILDESALLLFTPPARTVIAFVIVLFCLSVALLGAGAYSLDGLIYGKRRVLL